MNRLHEKNEQLDIAMHARAVEIANAREERGYVSAGMYVLEELRGRILDAIKGQLDEDPAAIHLSFIDREKLGGDVALRLTDLLRARGAKQYADEVVPVLYDLLQRAGFSVTAKGMYVNITLDDRTLFDSLSLVHALAERFGERDDRRGKVAVVEYSAPNAAKHLHAGHIRSTIVGEALARIYDAVGYTVHRTNHINDWGGFGAILEGYARWGQTIEPSENKNDELYQVYLHVRELEKHGGPAYDEFKRAADERFAKLEYGDAATVAAWEEMISWSLADFERFYRLFSISFDYSPGESFFADAGKAMVEEQTTAGRVLHFSEEDAVREIEFLEDALLPAERARREEEIRGKIGAWVVPLGGGKFFVVQRADGGSVYATRDIAALKYRAAVFAADVIAYVVGIEQTEHLQDLFAACRQLGVYDSQKTNAVHVPIGFYLSAESGKKLSSREGALGVMDLLAHATAHFMEKYRTREYAVAAELDESAIERNAHHLAIGSVIFNDLRKEHTLPVELSSDVTATLKEFEDSGGAYIMYALARARAIMRKVSAGAPVPDEAELAPLERSLIICIHEFPEVVARAAASANAAIVGNYLLELARRYNSYYASYPVLEGGALAYPHRLAITAAVAQCIENGLTLLNMHAPDIL